MLSNRLAVEYDGGTKYVSHSTIFDFFFKTLNHFFQGYAKQLVALYRDGRTLSWRTVDDGNYYWTILPVPTV